MYNVTNNCPFKTFLEFNLPADKRKPNKRCSLAPYVCEKLPLINQCLKILSTYFYCLLKAKLKFVNLSIY